jgi:putative tricarboxylic transport membrane protein
VKGGFAAAANPPGANGRIALLVALVAGYALLFQWLGFVIATALMVIAVGRLFGGTWRNCVIGGVSMGVLFFLLFDKVLDVVLPLGILGGVL